MLGQPSVGNMKSWSWWTSPLLINACFWIRDLFFEREELHLYYWSITLQGVTTLFVAAIGVAFLYERRQQNARLIQSNNQLTS